MGDEPQHRQRSEIMPTNPLRALQARGQSVWQDNITRDQLTSGHLERLIAEDGISGVTSNPTIFQKAVDGSSAYDAAVLRLVRAGKRPAESADELMIEDVRAAADALRPVWERTDGHDGYVSIEVSPRLARGTPRRSRRRTACGRRSIGRI
jgi:transaldolase